MHRSKQKLLLGMILLLILSIVGAACGKKDKLDETEVATYEGGTVTQAELNQFISSIKFANFMFDNEALDVQTQISVLKRMVGLKMLQANADDEIKKEAANEAKEWLEQYKTLLNNNEDGGFNKMLKQMDLSENQLQSFFEQEFIVMKSAEKNVTDEDAKDLYDEKLQQDEHFFDTVSVSHILIMIADRDGTEIRTKEEALAKADEVIAKLEDGADFATLAAEYSEDEGSKNNGGKYENEAIANSGWVPPFKEAASTLPVGQISEPIENDLGYHGYHVMRVDSRTTSTFEEIKPRLISEVANEAVSEFIEKEAEEKVTILLKET